MHWIDIVEQTSRLDIVEEKIHESEDIAIATIKNETQRKKNKKCPELLVSYEETPRGPIYTSIIEMGE